MAEALAGGFQAPPGLHRACIQYLLDSLFKLLDKVRKTEPTHLSVVDSPSTLAKKD